MCQHLCPHPSPAELVKKSRHRFEWPLFGLATLLTVCAFVIALGVSVYKQEALDVLQETAVAEYRAAHADAEKLSDTEVLAQRAPTVFRWSRNSSHTCMQCGWKWHRNWA